MRTKRKVKRKVILRKMLFFEATSKLNEKKVSLSCFGQVPQGTKMPLFQVPSSVVDDSPGGNDSAEMFKLQNPLFQHAVKEDPHFATQVKSDPKGGSPSRCEREGAVASVSETEFCVSEGIDDVRLVSGATAGECGIDGLLEEV